MELLWCPTKSCTEELSSEIQLEDFHPSGLESIPIIPKAIYLSTEVERHKHFNIKKVLKLFQRENKSLDKPLHDMGQFIKLGEPVRSIKQQMLSQNSNHSPWEGLRSRRTTLTSCPLSEVG